MTKSELEQYREQLLELGRRINADAEGLRDEALQGKGGEVSGSLSNTPMHLADLGSEAYEQEISLSLLEHKSRILEDIASAVRRIDEGAYGDCASCGVAINKNRLN